MVGSLSAPLRRLRPDTYIGAGKIAEIRDLVIALAADAVVFDTQLTPLQERNLARELGVGVVDRSGLILDIFAQRARSYEGKLQVEMAQLRHLATRLVRGWTHLERQKGGIGLRGPGETQLETDRRLMRKRMERLEGELNRVQSRRALSRRARTRGRQRTVALVGHTNAGKSTLFNRLSGAETLVADQMFATLDPLMRRVELASGGSVVIVDTVGFVRELPSELVTAFRATLEEVAQADLLLHVVDASTRDYLYKIELLQDTLKEIGAQQVPQLMVYNKIDRVREAEGPRLVVSKAGRPEGVWLSAHNREGLPLLDQAIGQLLGANHRRYRLQLPACDGAIRAELFGFAQILTEEFESDGGWSIRFDARQDGVARLVESGRLSREALCLSQ